MFVGARLKAEELGDAAVEFADGIGIEDFLFEGEAVPFPAPLAAAAQIAFAIERDDRGVLEWRGEVRSRGVGGVMIDGDHARFGEHAQCDRQGRAGRQRSGERYVVDVCGADAGDAQACRYGVLGQAAGLGSAGQFRFFDRGGDLAIFDDSGGCVAEDSADSENIQLPFPRFSILAQVSRSATVRLKTGLPGAVSSRRRSSRGARTGSGPLRLNVGQRRFQFAAGQDFERCGIQVVACRSGSSSVNSVS